MKKPTWNISNPVVVAFSVILNDNEDLEEIEKNLDDDTDLRDKLESDLLQELLKSK